MLDNGKGYHQLLWPPWEPHPNKSTGQAWWVYPLHCLLPWGLRERKTLTKMRWEALDFRLWGIWNQVGLGGITLYTWLGQWSCLHRVSHHSPPWVNTSGSLPPLFLSAIQSLNAFAIMCHVRWPGVESTQTIHPLKLTLYCFFSPPTVK